MMVVKHKPRADLAVIVLHWLVVAAVVISLATGATLARDRDQTMASLWALYGDIWPQGAVVKWHLMAGWLITGLVLAYLAYISRRKQWRRLLGSCSSEVGKADVGASGAVRRLTNWSSILLLLALVGLAISGTGLFLGTASSQVLLQWHATLATALLALTSLHVLLQIVAGRFWALLRIRWQRLALGLTSATVATVAVAGTGWWLLGAQQSLRIAHHEASINLDGVMDEDVWVSLEPVSIATSHGAGFDRGQTEVTVRGFHDGMSVYVLVQWRDPTRSQLHLPLERTAHGWRSLGAGIKVDDETEFYEDKLAMVWSDSPQLASAFTHHGQDLVMGPHRPVTRGLHYTTDGSVLDLWHWKSIRTGQQLPARLDDNHIGPLVPSVFAGHRYTGGYQPDWGAAGYSLNVCLRDDPDCMAVLKRVRETGEYEPVPGSARQRLQHCLSSPTDCESRLIPILLPEEPGDGQGMLTPATANIWSEAGEEALAPGSRVPGVLIDGRLGSDRGDVRAAGRWRDGVWTLEIQRALTTLDDKDISLMPGLGPRYLWVAPFDGSQTRHAHHLRPVRVDVKSAPEQTSRQ